MLLFHAANTFLSPYNCLNIYRTDCWLEGKLIGVGRWRFIWVSQKQRPRKLCPNFAFDLIERIENDFIQQSTVGPIQHQQWGAISDVLITNTATKKCESDRESVWNWQQTHRKSDTCLIFLYAAVAVKLTVRLTFGQHSNFRLTNSVSIAVSLSNVSISVSLFIGWEGLSNSRQTYYSLYLQLFSRFLSVAILTY